MKIKLLIVGLIACLMAGGLILTSCGLGCRDYDTCVNYYYYYCGMSGCSGSTVGYRCDC